MFRSMMLPILLVIFSLPGIASADTISLTAIDSGFVTEMGGSAKGDGTVVPSASFNYSVGQEEHYSDGALGSALAYMDRKNYFMFDMSGVTSPILSATLMVYMGPDDGPDFPDGSHGYESLDPSETFVVKETTDPGMALAFADMLFIGNMSGGTADFDDPTDPLVMAAKDFYTILGDGAPLAMITTTSDDDDTFLSIDFTSFGVAYLNLFVGTDVILAGDLATTDGTDTTQLIYGFTGPDVVGGTDPKIPELILTTVPEPSGVSFLAIATIGLVCFRRRCKKTVVFFA